jgi:thymidylate synthase ThyX
MGADCEYNSYFIPHSLAKIPHRLLLETYITHMDTLFRIYEMLTPKMQEWVDKILPKDVPNRKVVARTRAFDSLRYMLPIGTQTNLGMRINGRDTALLISKLMSSPIEEFRLLGADLKDEALEQLPSLVRYCEENEFFTSIEDVCAEFAKTYPYNDLPEGLRNRNYARMIGSPIDNDVLACQVVGMAMMSHYGNRSMIEMLGAMESGTAGRCKALIDTVLTKRGQFDPFPDEFDCLPLIFDVVIDYGAFRDLQRHRKCTQFPQLPTMDLGYETPEDIIDAGFEKEYRKAMEDAEESCEHFRAYVAAEQLEEELYGADLYMIPLAYRHRTLFTFTLKELAYIVELRTKPMCHISYRRVVREMYDEAMAVYPTSVKHIRCHPVPAPKYGPLAQTTIG